MDDFRQIFFLIRFERGSQNILVYFSDYEFFEPNNMATLIKKFFKYFEIKKKNWHTICYFNLYTDIR